MSTFDEAAAEALDPISDSTNAPSKTFKMGPFSRDEDLMIGGRVMQWYDKGPGLWESLEEEMGREKGSIMARFDYLAVRKFALDWHKELDDKLEEVVNNTPKPIKWADVAKEMRLKTKEVRSRWLTHHLALQQGRNVGPWTDEETAKLAEVVDSLPAGEPIAWDRVGERVQRAPLACARQWHEVRRERLRFATFSPAEDNFIWNAVRRLGPQARHVFEDLQKKLKRGAKQIYDHYYGVLLQSEFNTDMIPPNPEKAAKWKKKRNSSMW